MKIYNYHLPNSQNIGDEVCAATKYFPIDATIKKLGEPVPEDQDIVIWGGGCIAVQALNEPRTDFKKVIWGAGVTQRGQRASPTQPNYSGIDLAGIRDFPKPYGCDWVACPSSMSTLFDSPPEPTKDVVHFGHKKLSPMEQLNNDHMNFEEVINHLQSGEKVVTSSYHGMVWATLLGRDVEVHPFGSKFYGWPWYGKKAPADALDICRQSNLEFFEKFKKLL